jgi:hypothetical protein
VLLTPPGGQAPTGSALFLPAAGAGPQAQVAATPIQPGQPIAAGQALPPGSAVQPGQSALDPPTGGQPLFDRAGVPRRRRLPGPLIQDRPEPRHRAPGGRAGRDRSS